MRKGDIVQVKCENCGAGIDIAVMEECEYCGSSIQEEEYEDEVMFELDAGAGEKLIVYTDRVLIQREGIINAIATGTGDTSIFLTDITSIRYKKPRLFIPGYIQFLLSYGNQTIGGVFSAAGDENAILLEYNPEMKEIAEEIVDYLNNRISNIKSNILSRGTSSAAEEIKKFKSLLNQGIISKKEYEAKKKQLLDL